MSKPCEELAGVVQPNYKIYRSVYAHTRNLHSTDWFSLEQRNDLYVCIPMNGRHKWVDLTKLSQNKFHTYKEKITKTINDFVG